jgi:hypothetical protein
MAPARIRRFAALHLLAAQLFASGAVSLAHAREPLDAPSRIESAQHEHCPVLHDAAVCVLCAFSCNRATAPISGRTTVALPEANHGSTAAVVRPSAVPAPHTGDARAPPTSPA